MAWTILLVADDYCLASWRTLFTVLTTWLQRVILLDCCLLLLPCMCRYCGNWRIVRDSAATSTRSLRFPWPDTENTGRRLTLCSETQWVECCVIQVYMYLILCYCLLLLCSKLSGSDWLKISELYSMKLSYFVCCMKVKMNLVELYRGLLWIWVNIKGRTNQTEVC